MERANPELVDALARLETAWTLAGDRETSRLLAPGISPQEMGAATAHLQLELHEDVIAWFSWHNGEAAFPRPAVMGPALMVATSIELAVEMYGVHLGYAREGAEWSGGSLAEAGWDPHWFPVFKDLAGTVCAVDCSVEEGQAAPVRMVFKADEDPSHIDAPGLLWVVERWIWAIESGVSRYINGQWETDRSRVPDDLDASCLL